MEPNYDNITTLALSVILLYGGWIIRKIKRNED